MLDNVIQNTNSLLFHICEYIGGPNLALKRPAFSTEELNDINSNYLMEYVNDGHFPLQQNFESGLWHGDGLWVFLQIKLASFYPVKTVIFQTR